METADALKLMVNEVVDMLIEVGTNHSWSGNYHISFKEASRLSGIEHDWIVAHADDIMDELSIREETIEEQWFDYDEDGNKEGFDMLFGLAYCPYAQDDEEGDEE